MHQQVLPILALEHVLHQQILVLLVIKLDVPLMDYKVDLLLVLYYRVQMVRFELTTFGLKGRYSNR